MSKLIFEGVPGQAEKAHTTDAGYDLIASVPMVVPAGSKALIPTGLRASIPPGWVGIIKSRSGLAAKHDLEVGAGVIDCGYTGEIIVLLRNFSNIDYTVDSGDKIAQLVVLPIFTGITQYDEISTDTERGEDGFNSTGYKNGQELS